MAVAWDRVTHEDVVRAIKEYDRLFEGGKTGAVKVLGQLGFTIAPRRSAKTDPP